MYNIVRNSSLKALLTLDGPPLLISFVIASLFFKGWGFALECLAFLALWFAVDAAWTFLNPKEHANSHDAQSAD